MKSFNFSTLSITSTVKPSVRSSSIFTRCFAVGFFPVLFISAQNVRPPDIRINLSGSPVSTWEENFTALPPNFFIASTSFRSNNFSFIFFLFFFLFATNTTVSRT